jgi:hypothetical protein
MLYKNINFSQFCDAFRDAGREDQFTYEAKSVLFDYLDTTGETSELDVVAICCEYTESDYTSIIEECGFEDAFDYDTNEYPTLEDFVQDNDEEVNSKLTELLNKQTLVVGEVCGGLIYVDF